MRSNAGTLEWHAYYPTSPFFSITVRFEALTTGPANGNFFPMYRKWTIVTPFQPASSIPPAETTVTSCPMAASSFASQRTCRSTPPSSISGRMWIIFMESESFSGALGRLCTEFVHDAPEFVRGILPFEPGFDFPPEKSGQIFHFWLVPVFIDLQDFSGNQLGMLSHTNRTFPFGKVGREGFLEFVRSEESHPESGHDHHGAVRQHRFYRGGRTGADKGCPPEPLIRVCLRSGHAHKFSFASRFAFMAASRNFMVLHPPPTKTISREGIAFFSRTASSRRARGPADLYPLMRPKHKTLKGSLSGIDVGVINPLRGLRKRNLGKGVLIRSSSSSSGGSAESHASLKRIRESTSRPLRSVFSRLSRKKVRTFAPVTVFNLAARGKERRESVTMTSGANSLALRSNQVFPTVGERH